MLKYAQYNISFQEVPDEISLVFSISHCLGNCKGCHSPYLQQDIGKDLESDYLEIIEKYKDYITCICFLGGDRFPYQVNKLFSIIKKTYPHLKTCMYSGKHYEFSQFVPTYYQYENFDYYKNGEYVEELGGLDKETTNQKMIKILGFNNAENITYKFREKKL